MHKLESLRRTVRAQKYVSHLNKRLTDWLKKINMSATFMSNNSLFTQDCLVN
jgi:hypothetical protein